MATIFVRSRPVDTLRTRLHRRLQHSRRSSRDNTQDSSFSSLVMNIATTPQPPFEDDPVDMDYAA